MQVIITKISITILCCLFFINSIAQHNEEFRFAVTNNNAAYPFSKLSGLFRSPLHPGVEFTYGFNWKTKPTHDFYQQVNLAYFYHRFVQHGIPLYTNFGYRYKFSVPFFAEASIGMGYLHSIPATAKLKLAKDGAYENNKGIGRMQAMFVFNVNIGYVIHANQKNPVRVFVSSQQRIQTPFVKSYVPLLPYNSIMIGAALRLKNK